MKNAAVIIERRAVAPFYKNGYIVACPSTKAAAWTPAAQINVRAGEFPEPEDNGISYLKLPLDALGGGH